MNLFYSENAVGGFSRRRTIFRIRSTSPAYVWGYQTRENYNNRKQMSVNVKTDYRYSFNSKFCST